MPIASKESTRRQKWDNLQTAPRRCLRLKIAVLRARNVTLGRINDFFDIPDPYVTLKIPHSAEGFAKTVTKTDDTNPVWNQTFIFHLDSEEDNVLEIGLWDEDYNKDDQVGENVYFNLNDIPVGEIVNKTFAFAEASEVDVQFETFDEKEANDLRYGKELCKEEIAFLDKRKSFVLEAMQNVLGERAPQNLDEVPNIAVLGSGGGYRATTGFTAACRALDEMQLMDCVTYLTALSGSAWGLSMMYAQMQDNTLCVEKTQSHIREHLDRSPWRLFTPSKIMAYVKEVMKKSRDGQPVSLTDVYGHIVGTHLMDDDKIKHKLSDQREKIKDACTPIPIYTALNSKKDVSADRVAEWVEFTPYEVGMNKYGTFMKPELFGSQFFCGKLVKQYPETPLFYLQGIWGSFYAISIQRVMEEKRRLKGITEDVKRRLSKGFYTKKVTGDMQTSAALQNFPHDNSSDDEELETELKMAPHLTSEPVGESEEFSESEDEICSAPEDLEYELSNSISEQAFDNTDRYGSSSTGDMRSSENDVSESSEKHAYTQKQQKPLVKVFEFVVESVPGLRTRQGRAGVIHNFMRGLQLEEGEDGKGKEEDVKECTDEVTSSFMKDNTKKQKIELIDAGLQFNSPYPPVLRPERDVELILSFDFSARDKDSVPPFKNLKLAEKWAESNNVPFPPINADQQWEKDGLKECYVFRHPTDLACPIVLHFALINNTFREFKEPGVPRVTNEEKSEGDFAIFDDINGSYSTFNLHYTNPIFDSLSRLVEFNTALNEDLIKDCIVECVRRRRRIMTNH